MSIRVRVGRSRPSFAEVLASRGIPRATVSGGGRGGSSWADTDEISHPWGDPSITDAYPSAKRGVELYTHPDILAEANRSQEIGRLLGNFTRIENFVRMARERGIEAARQYAASQETTPQQTVEPNVADTVDAINARMGSVNTSLQPPQLTEEDYMQDPEYRALTDLLVDISGRLGRLEAGVGFNEQAATESAARTAGLTPEIQARIQALASERQGAIDQSTAEAQAGIREAYDIANANLDRVLEATGGDVDAAASAAAAGQVNALADEFLEEAERAGASANEMADAASAVAEAEVAAAGAANDTKREELRSLTELGLQEHIRVAAEQRERAERDRAMLQEAMQKEANAEWLESIPLDVPITEQGFIAEAMRGDWIRGAANTLGLGELSDVDEATYLQTFFEELAPFVSNPEEYEREARILATTGVQNHLLRKINAGDLAVTPEVAELILSAVRFDPKRGAFIDRSAIETALRAQVESDLNTNVEYLRLKHGDAKGVSAEEAARRMRQMEDEAMANYLPSVDLNSLIDEQVARETQATYRLFGAMRDQYTAAQQARQQWLKQNVENQRSFPGGSAQLVTVLGVAAERAGFPNPEEIARSPALHAVVSSLNPSGRHRATKDKVGVGLFNLPSTVYRQFGAHLGDPDKLSPVDQAEAFLLYLNAKYGGDPYRMLESLRDRGRI